MEAQQELVLLVTEIMILTLPPDWVNPISQYIKKVNF